MALTGLRAGQVLGLRRQDLHLVPSAADYELIIPGVSERCRINGEHVHVIRRRNPNGAWSKAEGQLQLPRRHDLVGRDAGPQLSANEATAVTILIGCPATTSLLISFGWDGSERTG